MNNTVKSDRAVALSETLLGIGVSELEARQSAATAREIVQQPRVWREAGEKVKAARAKIDAWLQPKLAIPQVQVIFCGAGTSSFIGESVAAWLRSRKRFGQTITFESVSTTDLAASPAQYLASDRPTIMVSFARSGDSPESVFCFELAAANLSQCFHLVLTCNPDGQLATSAQADPTALCLLMPEGTNDIGFAMTSSYSSMLVTSLAIFTPDDVQLERASSYTEKLLQNAIGDITGEVDQCFDRLVVLGSGSLLGSAREGALKCLELTAGKVMAISDTPLGFRHGPKILITPNTVIIHMRSSDPYTSKYDQDLLNELRSEGIAGNVIELSLQRLLPNESHSLDDIWLSLVYVVYCQVFAVLKAYSLGGTVDSPCPSGEVNRVVQGVKIYNYKLKKPELT